VPSKREWPDYVCAEGIFHAPDVRSVLATASLAIRDLAGSHTCKLDAHQPIEILTAHFVDEGKRNVTGY